MLSITGAICSAFFRSTIHNLSYFSRDELWSENFSSEMPVEFPVAMKTRMFLIAVFFSHFLLYEFAMMRYLNKGLLW